MNNIEVVENLKKITNPKEEDDMMVIFVDLKHNHIMTSYLTEEGLKNRKRSMIEGVIATLEMIVDDYFFMKFKKRKKK